ncbi:hypothetical protein BD560DRAFT_322509, partial [Blakeslea trispora]
PSPFLSDKLSLDAPLLNSPTIPEDQRCLIIYKYLRKEGVQYQLPITIPVVARKMSYHQSEQNMSLKGL